MFHDIPAAMRQRMAYLEERDRRERQDGTPRMQRLRQIPPETGRFLALLAAGAPAGRVVEIGASGGYSSLWLALACRLRGDQLTTFEVLEDKARLARETFSAAGVEGVVRLIHGDARAFLPEMKEIAFCFMDAEKEIYTECYELALAGMVDGGLFTADNILSHQEELQPFVDHVMADPRASAVVVPIGKGLLLARKAGRTLPSV